MATSEIDTFPGPKPKRDLAGRVAVEFDQINDVDGWLPEGDWQASVIGWGHQLVAGGADLGAVARAVERKYGAGRVAIARGQPFNPLGWPEAQW